MTERGTELPNSPMQHDGETYGPRERAWSEWTRGPREGYPDRVAHYFAANDDPALVHLAFVAGWNARETSQSKDVVLNVLTGRPMPEAEILNHALGALRWLLNRTEECPRAQVATFLDKSKDGYNDLTVRQQLEQLWKALTDEYGGGRFGKSNSAEQALQPTPIPMWLKCPYCFATHIDRDEWATRPHKTHLCEYCGIEWRPAEVYTVGIEPWDKALNP